MTRRAKPVLPLACGLILLAFSGCNSESNPNSGALFGAGTCPSTATVAPPTANPPVTSTGLSLKRTQINTAFTLTAPLFLTVSPIPNDNRLFVVEQGGIIKVADRATGMLIGTGVFLDISTLVSKGSEQGLLGLAFDPQYASNGRFYVSYTDTTGIGNSVIARYLVNPNDPNVAIPTADRIILTLTQPDTNHNGGMIGFGPDGFLYIGFGDGGGAGDLDNHAQNLGEQLGKLLRINVSGGAAGQPAYTVPADNPCVGQNGAKPEIWNVGLRNPWRWSFDRGTGDLYIADVGQGEREEVNVASVASGRGRGVNYGWHITEGSLCFSPSSNCSKNGLTLPNVEYDHTAGACSITGGYVYRGAAIPALQGTYFYADYCAGFVRSFRMANGGVTEHFTWAALGGGNISSFGEDAAGELYILTLGGGLYRIDSN
jgi:glucose/arabinose dehydrogenase